MDSGQPVTLRASAKVNLALHVTGRRSDGYHLVDSIAVFADIGDRVDIAPAQELTLRVSGRFAVHAPGDKTDLAWRAASAFFDHVAAPERAAISIDKNLPAGAGLGGGSADAAAVLIGLNRLHGAGLSAQTLAAIGLRLGADVPMCLIGTALRARGVGEEIEPLEDWPTLPTVLIWPGVPVPTAACFAALDKRDNPGLPVRRGAETTALAAAWLAGCRNDLQGPALRLEPAIGDALTALRDTDGCLLARMTGSGSACFGLYATAEAAEAAAARLRKQRADWWVVATSTR